MSFGFNLKFELEFFSLSLRIELSFKVGRVGTLGGRVRVGTLGGGLGTLGVNLNLVSSSSSKLRLRLSFIIGFKIEIEIEFHNW